MNHRRFIKLLEAWKELAEKYRQYSDKGTVKNQYYAEMLESCIKELTDLIEFEDGG